MSPDHLSEEGLAELENLDIPFSIIFLISLLLGARYIFHFKYQLVNFWICLNLHDRLLSFWTYILAIFTILHALMLLIWNTTKLRKHQTLPRVETDLVILLKPKGLWMKRQEWSVHRFCFNISIP